MGLATCAALAGCALISLDGLTGGDGGASSGGDASMLRADATVDAADGGLDTGVLPPPDAPADAGVSSDDADASDACVSVDLGLIAHYTMAPSSIQGATLGDVSGNGNSAQLVAFGSPPTVDAGPYPPALDYTDSDGGYVNVPTLPLDTAPGHVNTFAFWFYRSSQSVDDVLVFAPASPRYDLWLTGSDLCFNTGIYNCWGISNPAIFGHWVHVAAVFSNGAISGSSLYVDGLPVTPVCIDIGHGTDCGVDASVAEPVTLGGPGSTGYVFLGLLEDVRVYDRALTAAEVQAIYAGTACP